MSKDGHPLPESAEARHNEVPEEAQDRKGHGEDGAEPVQATRPVEPDGTAYPAGDLGRGPPANQEK